MNAIHLQGFSEKTLFNIKEKLSKSPHSKLFRNYLVLANQQQVKADSESDLYKNLLHNVKRELRNIIHSVLFQMNDSNVSIQELVYYLLKHQPSLISDFKCGLNYLWNDNIREISWIAKLNGWSEEFEEDTQSNDNSFGICIAFLEKRANLHFLMADYQSIRYMEESLELSTNIPEDLILSISIPLILTLKNQRQKDQFQVDYKKLFYRLKSILINEISDIHQLINYQVSEVLKLIRNLEPQFNWNSFDENDIQSIIEYLLSDLFVGVCSTTVLLHIYDQILLFSSNSTKDMLLPSIQNWITWTVASIIIITLNCEKIDFKIDTAKEYIHSIKANALMKTLNEYFINTIRDSITATTTSNLSNTEEVDIDDVVSITEEDFEDLQTSVFEREVIVWKKKKAFKKNIRIRILFSKWKKLVRYIIIWQKYIQIIQEQITQKNYDRLVQMENEQRLNRAKEIVPEFVAPVILEKVTPVKVEKYKRITSIFLKRVDQEVKLNGAGSVIDDIQVSIHSIFGDANTIPINYFEETETFYEEDIHTITKAGELMDSLMETTQFIFGQ